MNRLAFILPVVAAAFPITALAKEKPPVFVEAKHVKDTPVVTLDPAKAYVTVRTFGPMPLHFVRIPTAEEQAVYDKLKAAAFVEAREDYQKKLARYEKDLVLSKKTQGMATPKKPQEPTEENFTFPSFGQMANFTTGLQNRFAKKGGSVYLHAITPGKYRLYGQVDPLLGAGVCYCMGSVTFEASAGKITDLGSMDQDEANAVPRTKGDSSSPQVSAQAFALTPANDTLAVDPRLSALPRVPADLRAAGKVANYMGIAISRLPAIKGVLSYDRDRIIDVKNAPQTAAN